LFACLQYFELRFCCCCTDGRCEDSDYSSEDSDDSLYDDDDDDEDDDADILLNNTRLSGTPCPSPEPKITENSYCTPPLLTPYAPADPTTFCDPAIAPCRIFLHYYV